MQLFNISSQFIAPFFQIDTWKSTRSTRTLPDERRSMSQDIIVVHIGAGRHSPTKRRQYRKLLRSALAKQDFTRSSQVIEGCSLTNTGFGSSLNLLGKVECDASCVHLGNSHLQRSMVGMDNCMFPISNMNEIYDKLSEFYKNNQFGLSEPVSLNYQSLKESSFGIEGVSESTLISKDSQSVYDLYSKDFNLEISDTIGILHVKDGTTQLGSSSGGNAFKMPGRIGCSGIIGAAIDAKINGTIELTCMCSGNGEDIISMKLSNYIVSNFQLDYEDHGLALMHLIQKSGSSFSLKAVNNDKESIIYVGVILTIRDLQTGKMNLVYCHSTESFYFGFKVDHKEENVVLSELNNAASAGKSFAYGEFKLN